MSDQLDLLIFRTAERHFGIDSTEVERVIKYKTSIPLKYENKKNHLYADQFLNLKINPAYSATLIINSKNNKQLFLTIPVLEDMITINYTKLIAVPELIKEKQDPFIVWGFVESEERFITLITFDYYEEIVSGK